MIYTIQKVINHNSHVLFDILCKKVLVLIERLLTMKKIFKSLAVIKELYKMNYNERLENNIKLATAEGMGKRYHRINKRHKRKAMPEFTFEQFAEKVRKEENSLIVIEVITAVLYILIFLNGVVSGIMDNGIRGGIVYGAVYLIIMGLSYYYLYQHNKKMSKYRLNILEECEELNISLSEYVDKGYEDDTFLYKER